jgi:hypothetical protein
MLRLFSPEHRVSHDFDFWASVRHSFEPTLMGSFGCLAQKQALGARLPVSFFATFPNIKITVPGTAAAVSSSCCDNTSIPRLSSRHKEPSDVF